MISLLQSAVEPIGTVAENAGIQQEMTLSLFSLFLKGGALMWVLLLLSVLAIYLIGKKWWTIHQIGQLDKNFMVNIKELILDERLKTAKALCARTNSPIARMAAKGIEKLGKSKEEIQSAIENVGNAEVAKVEKGLPILATISGGAPMIGFLGTVIGMVQAFFNMSQAGNNIDITMLSGGIYVAMVTTVGGLIVGIIAYFGYNYLSAKISELVYLLEKATADFMDILNEQPAKKEE